MKTLKHPDLPGVTVSVQESSVSVYAAAGWLVTEPIPESPRRRRTTPVKEDD